MATAIIDGIGSGNKVIVDNSNRLYTTGSITSMPSISVATGSQVWVQNPVGISGTREIGSVVIKSAPLIGVSGAIFDSGDITGSMVISSSTRLGVSGNINVNNPVGISGTSDIGSVVISSAPLLGVSGLIFTDGNLTGSMAMKGTGSMVIASSVRLGGSIVNLPGDLGSVVIASAPLLGVSGLIFTDGKMTGSMAMKGIGSMRIASSTLLGVSGLIFTDGNLTGSVSLQGVGSVIIKSAPLIGVSGLIFTGGNLTGSVAIQNEITMQDVGSPCFKTSYLIASGAWSQTWSIGGAGSKLEIHGWHISTNLPGQVRVLISGVSNNAYDSGLIANYFVNFASGGVVEKTFATPIIPAGAGSAIGFGTSSAGSTNFTIFGREVK